MLLEEIDINPILLKHQVFGIDFDGTLIDHHKSHKLWAFVNEYSDRKDFYIITFRNNAMFVWEDLKDSTTLINRSYFGGAYGVDPRFFVDAQYYNDYLQHEKIPTKVSTNLEYYRQKWDEWCEWKGKKCHQLGCTLLIDDRESEVLPGCVKYNIEYLHPNDL